MTNLNPNLQIQMSDLSVIISKLSHDKQHGESSQHPANIVLISDTQIKTKATKHLRNIKGKKWIRQM